MKYFLLLAIAALTLNCSNSELATDTSGQTIVIDTMTFIPSTMTAAAGETITIINDDSVTHTITSQSVADAFDDNGDFDSGLLPTGAAGSFTVPSDAVAGDIFFFYCAQFEDGMATPNGTITVE